VGYRCYSNAEGRKYDSRVPWLPHQPCHGFDDVSTPVFDRALVIVIPSHILESV